MESKEKEHELQLRKIAVAEAVKKRQKLEEGEQMRAGSGPAKAGKALDIEEFKKLHSLKVTAPKRNLAIIDDECEGEEAPAEEVMVVDTEKPVVAATARTKADLLKRLAEKRRELLMKQYGDSSARE